MSLTICISLLVCFRDSMSVASQSCDDADHAGLHKDGASSGDGGSKYALRLLATLARDKENVFVSPLSLGMALGMAEAGATEGSAHEAALRRFGSAHGATDGLVVANSVWTRA